MPVKGNSPLAHTYRAQHEGFALLVQLRLQSLIVNNMIAILIDSGAGVMPAMDACAPGLHPCRSMWTFRCSMLQWPTWRLARMQTS